MDLIVSNQIIILAIAAQISIQALITRTIMAKILMEISINNWRNNYAI
jgi:hypothetical protein